MRRNVVAGVGAAGDGGMGRSAVVFGALGAGLVAALVALMLWATLPVLAQSGGKGYQKKVAPLETPWTDEVGPDNALPKYPRPQMVRDEWKNLNGVWQFNGAAPDEKPPIGRELPERVLVPYPVESALSGIKRHENHMYYRRTFEVPKGWKIGGNERLKLNFGAVDYETTVWVNGEMMGSHEGGYDKFSFDITNALENRGKQEIVVGVTDLTDRGNPPFARPYNGEAQPTGKQTLRPGGIFYTAASGIWQTVWMEPVSRSNITRLDMTPDVGDESLSVTVNAARAGGTKVKVTAYKAGGAKAGSVTGPANTELRLPVPNPKLWSPDNPYLYDMKVRLLDGGREVDAVDSYFGMRSVSIEEGEDGKPRMYLNGEFLANMGTLDQGYWPDGVYTAPTDEALKFDLKAHKELGYNMVRKHIKVEPDRWFYHADRLGLIVWQDMPSFPPTFEPDAAAQQQFEDELKEMIEEHKSFTSITTWVPYNEGWGERDQQTTARVSDMVKELDPSRLVNAHSGVNCCESQGDSGAGDIYDQHNYQDPPLPVPFDDRATVAGEYGGVALYPGREHEYDSNLTFSPYGSEESPDALTERYEDLQDKMRRGVQSCGVSSGVYTEITDLEGEINGMYTYDRQVFKPGEENRDRIVAANESVIAASENANSEGIRPLPPGTPGPNGVGYYPFSEGSGMTTEDEGDDATDQDGAVNGPTWTTGHPGSPAPDSGLQFDGQNDFVDLGDPVVDTTGNYTVAAWIKLDNLNSFYTAVSQDTTGPVSAFFLQYHKANNRLQFAFPQGNVRSDAPPVAGQWYHMVGVRDAEGGTYKLYVDGVLQDTNGQPRQCSDGDGPTGDAIIGRARFNNGPVDWFPGSIDQVHLYDRALSDTEVTELFSSGR